MAIDALFKVIADPTRRAILAMLRQRPMTAGEIAERFAITKPAISHHLSTLKDADLIFGERDGTTITYRLNMSVFELLVTAMLEIWKGVPDEVDPPQ